MGVRGLLRFCKNNNCYEEYDLVELAKNNKNLEILVDLYAFVHYMSDMTLKRLASQYNNEFLLIPGAEYDEHLNAFRKFHLMFTNMGIKLVYIADGPKGIDENSRRNKEKTWDSRFHEDMRIYDCYLSYCNNPEQAISTKLIRPCLLSEYVKNVIKNEGGEVINLIYGEADHQIANLRKQRNSWAVLTNDSDFFVFHDCPTIHFDFFDLYKNLVRCPNLYDNRIANNSRVRPRKLVVGVITDKILMKELGLSTHDKLIDFSVLMGNDYTAHYAKKFRDFYGIICKETPNNAYAVNIARWVRDQSNILLYSEEFQTFSENNPEYFCPMSVQFSMDFYKQRLTDPIVEFTSMENEEFWNYLIERYKNLEISTMCLSVFHGFWYQKNCVQGSNRDINSLLSSLRSEIFSLFLQNGLSSVLEYEVPSTPSYTRFVNVPASSVNLKSFLQSPKIHNPYTYFDKNWSQFDFDKSLLQNVGNITENQSWNYFKKFGSEIGFCCYCLRVLWLVTKRTKIDELDLVLTEPEFRSVFCTVFFRLLRRVRSFSPRPTCLNLINKYPNDWFLKLKICPSSVCEITQEWLQVIYLHAHSLYGKSLNIAQYFPEVNEFISGTVLTVFFEYAHNNAQRLGNLEATQKNDIYKILSTIGMEFRYIYRTILKPL